MANTKLDIRQVVVRAQLPLVGNAANEQADSVLSKVDSSISKLYEDRNITIIGNGNVTFSGTTITTVGDLKLNVNSRVAGGSPVEITILDNITTIALSTDGDMWYTVIDRIAGTAVNHVVSAATGLPQVIDANKEVFLIAQRIDDSFDATKRVYFRTGFTMSAGDSAKYGSGGSSSFDPSTILVDDVTGQVVTSDVTGDVILSG